MKKSVLTLLCAVFCATVILAQNNNRIPSKGFAVFSPHGGFQLHNFTRHTLGDNDILVKTLYSSICHSDIHTIHNEWEEVDYPLVPGHEMVGQVVAIGKNVTKFKVGDYAGVGCMVNSCGHCEECLSGNEQDCTNGQRVMTYGSKDMFHDNETTQGLYADNMVISEKFAFTIPKGADLKRVAPLLCAGITTYAPIRLSNVKAGENVALAGFGGLGHLAVKYMVKLGAKVTVFDISEEKRQTALDMGAVRYVNVNHPDEVKAVGRQFDFILNTIPYNHDLTMYTNMVKRGGEMCVVGFPAFSELPSLNVLNMIRNEHVKVYGSRIGGVQQTQEMLDYSVANNIYPDVTLIKADARAIDDAVRNVQDGKVQFRYIIDMTTL